MIAKLRKANIVGHKSELRSVIEVLKSTGNFELINFRRTSNESNAKDNENRDRLVSLQGRTRSVITFAKNSASEFQSAYKVYKRNNKNSTFIAEELKNAKKDKAVWNEINEITYDALKSASGNADVVNNLIENLETIAARLREIKSAIGKNTETIRDLKPYITLPSDFDRLQDTEHTHILCGIMPANQLERFRGDLDLAKVVIAEYPAGTTKTVVVVTCLHEDAAIANTIYGYGFERCRFRYDQNAIDKIQTLHELNISLDFEYLTVLKKAIISCEDIRLLKTYYDYLTNEIDTFELQSGALQTERCYILTGWFPAKEEQNITELIKKTSPEVAITITEAGKFDAPPVLVKNSKLIAPYGSITTMYGSPSKGDLDPNPFVAFFFFIFFGMMIGDTGYGLLLFGLLLLFYYMKKPQGGAKNLILLFCISSISAVIWGFIYGSFFGNGAFMPSPVLDPLEGAQYLLLLSLGLGVVQIFVGICLNFVKHLKNRDFASALLDSFPRIVLFIGLMMFLPNAAFKMFSIELGTTLFVTLSKPGMYIALAGIVGIILTSGRGKKGILGKITGAFSGAYGLVNYLSDVISYARLFGLALVGCVIGYIGNTMGVLLFGIPVIGFPLGVLLAIIFHAFNIGLGLLGAYVHGARLQFVEFFGKFYKGEGTPFAPMGSNLQYSRIVMKR